LITAGLLQILSNLANDYGDAVKGSDKPDRIGPLRGMQKGVITQAQMKRALIITVVLICLSGLALLSAAWQTTAISSALWCWVCCDYRRHHLHRRHAPLRLYRPGDISVLVFFGWLSVMGSWYLTGAYADPCHFPAGDRLRSAGDCGAEYQ
jgi:1,4-dihydroxy-2-naphthoate octaprenyltransferase